MIPFLWCSAELLQRTQAQHLHTCQINIYCEMKHLVNMELAYLIFN